MAKKEEKKEHDENFRYIVRIANTDIDGERPLTLGLTAIKGVGMRLATAVVDDLELPRYGKIGEMSDQDTDRIEEHLKIINEQLPPWLLNRQKDIGTGDDMHYYGAELPVRIKDDVNFLKKIRCYRGIRHENNHKVRGQRTRSNGRRGLTLGVSRKRA